MFTHHLCLKYPGTCGSLEWLPPPSSMRSRHEETSQVYIPLERHHPVGPKFGPLPSSGRSLERQLMREGNRKACEYYEGYKRQRENLMLKNARVEELPKTCGSLRPLGRSEFKFCSSQMHKPLFAHKCSNLYFIWKEGGFPSLCISLENVS